MPNWCSTKAVVYGPLKDVMTFKQFIEKALGDAPEKEAYEPNKWLGQLVIAASGDSKNCYCRGWIYDISEMETNKDGESHFIIISEDAWSPLLPAVLQHVIDNKFPDANLSMDYIAEESGMGIFVNTDTTGTFFPERYLIIDDYDYNYLTSEEEVYKYMSENKGISCSTLDEVKAWMKEQDDVWFCEFESE